MATKKISELESMNEADESDVLAIVDVSEGTTKKITKGNLLTGAGHSIEIQLNTQTYQLEFKLKNEQGTVLSTQTLDLPSENAITGITYSNGVLILTKQSGGTSTVDISGLISGLVTETTFSTFVTEIKSVIGISTNTYNSANTYNTGDIVVQNEKIYKANQDNVTGTFDATKWDEISLYEELEENHKEIIKLEQKVATQKEIISQNPQVTDTDYEPTLADTIEAPFTEFEVKGHSEQETTEGYNLAEINETEWSYLDNGNITNKNNPVSGRVLAKIEAKANEAINVYLKLISKPNADCSFTGSGVNFSRIDTFNLNQVYKQTFTVAEDTTAQIRRWGDPISNTFEFQFWAVKGENETYEKFTNGASPNPSYEQPVKSAGENVNELNENDFEVGSIDSSTGQNVSSNLEFRTTSYIEVNKATNYTLSNQNYIKYTHRGIFEYDENHNYIKGTNNQIISLKDGFTLKTSSTTRYIRIRYIVGQSSSDVITEVPENMKIKLERGTVATPWTPYGMGCVNEKIQNKNLLNPDGVTKTSGGITLTNNGNGTFTISGTSTSGNINLPLTTHEKEIVLKANKPYTQSIDIISGSLSGFSIVPAFENNEGSVYYNYFFNNQTKISTQDLKCLRYNAYISTNGVTINCTFRVQLEQGSTATSYVPHEEQNISIPVQQPMRSMGEVEDEFVLKNDGKWYERHYIGRVIFDGSNDEKWRFQDTSTTPSNRTVISKDNNLNNKYDNDYLSNMFIKEGSSPNRFALTSTLYLSLDDSLAGITSNDDNSTRLTKVLTYMSTHNVVIQYELAEPTDIPCTQLQSDILDSLTETVHTYKGVTDIISSDEVKAKLSVSGLYDLNKLLTRVETLESEV